MQFCICETRGTEIQGREVKVRQICVKSEVQTLRTESGVDLKSDSGSLFKSSYFPESAMATMGEWRD